MEAAGFVHGIWVQRPSKVSHDTATSTHAPLPEPSFSRLFLPAPAAKPANQPCMGTMLVPPSWMEGPASAPRLPWGKMHDMAPRAGYYAKSLARPSVSLA